MGAPTARRRPPYLDGPLPCDAGGPCFPPPVVLVSGQPKPPTLLAVDTTHVYFTDDWGIFECGLGGCNQTPTTLWSSTHFYIEGIAVSNGSVYFPAGAQYVASCATSGCNQTPTNLLSTLNTHFYGFAADALDVYWAGDSAVQACSLGGCNEAPYTYATPPNTEALGVGDGFVAWTQEDTMVAVCPKGGCVGAPLVLATNQWWASAIAVANGVVYWIVMGQANGGHNVPISKYTNGAVVACAVTGCGGNPTVLASYPLWLGGGAIVADATSVYWSTEDISGTFGEIVGCPSSGCNGAPKVYATTHTKAPTRGVALDPSNVYWTDQGLAAVLATARF